ncbi:MAG: hypothetical protein PHC60_08990, partial [Heliobacteriaceae bacterium]|nr:hypothetical protein [Heliobacteriaceae bacterium]
PVFSGSPGQPGAQPLSNPAPIPPAPETTLPQTLPATLLQPVDPAPPPGPAAPPEYLVAEALAGLQLPAKSFVVQTVTRQLHQAAEEFRTLKREITRNLDSVLQIVNSTKNPVLAQARPLLETAIDRLDNAILKSPITLFTDMATEKHLLTASSRLALARKFLAEGNNTRAAAIVTEVKTQLEQLNWRPAAVKVQHLLTRPVFANANPTPARLTAQMAPFTPAGPEPTPREIYDLIRSFGLNHDSEAAQALTKTSAGPNPNPEDLNQNLKAALLQLTGPDRDTGLKPEFRPLADQLLNSLTGQQLLSKADPATGLQTMFFHLPVLIEDRQANLKVWVNSRNNKQKIDWENCNLYFLIDTQKLGETGIWIAATDRNLTVTVRNDHPNCRDIVAPLTAKYKSRLEAVGYQINDINFTRLREPAPGSPATAPAPPAVPLSGTGPLKGVDCKI